jgi:hypothetical protein
VLPPQRAGRRSDHIVVDVGGQGGEDAVDIVAALMPVKG